MGLSRSLEDALPIDPWRLYGGEIRRAVGHVVRTVLSQTLGEIQHQLNFRHVIQRRCK